MRLVTEGRNRLVIVAGGYAIKLPSPRSWRDFLFGLLNNLNERDWCRDYAACCPVLWAAPLGLAIVMPRAEILDEDSFRAVMADLPLVDGAERKPSSWGWLEGELVAVDYGWR